jgi:regulator of sigma E protease
MSWLLAFLGFAALIILHELGHFAAAKAVGMRVERFSLFFPPLLLRRQRGETEYAVGAIPLGGYVKITGMNPAEEIPPEVAHRAYFRQPVWKRVVVIAAGPVVNIALAFVILAIVFMHSGTREPPPRVQSVTAGKPAAQILKADDELVAIDGHRPTGKTVDDQNATIMRLISVSGTPVYDPVNRRVLLGFALGGTPRPAGPLRAAGLSADSMWQVTSGTISTLAGILNPQKRKQISGVVGTYEVTRQTVKISATQTFFLLAVISLSLGVINLFPFLPLDGGHIFWALAEKVRGRAIPFSVMERAGFVGFALVIGLFVIGFTNDMGRLLGDGFNVR